jgi:DNA helicase-2/ATP-dependent DNA helicase PcrA
MSAPGDLTPMQAEAAAQDGAVLVLAGAGTGKTKTLTAAVVHRIRAFGVKPHRILAVTFTNKAAGEMTGRIREALGGEGAPGWLGTFHSLAARQLRTEPEVAGLRPGFDILDADDGRRLVRRILKAMNRTGDESGDPPAGRDPVKIIANRISQLKDRLISPEEAPAYCERVIAEADRTGDPVDADGLRLTARIYADYQQRLGDANAADFGDLLLWPARAMQRDQAYRDRWAGRFDCVLADEYQDVNHAQYIWLRLLAVEHGRIFVVGDDDQAVFGWRGSDISYIRRFTCDFPEAVTFRLEENFRSTGTILAAANAVIAKDENRLGKTLFTRKEMGEPIEVVGFHDGQAEAAGIAAEIARRHGLGIGWEEMAILYRSNYLSRAFEEALMRARIPYVLVGDVGFYQRAEIKDTLALLRLSAQPDDRQSDEAFRRVINVPARGFGPKAMAALEAEAQWRGVSLLQALETAPLPPRCRSAGLAFADAVRSVAADADATLADQLSLLLDAADYRAMLRESRAETTEDRLENLQELLTIAASFHTARELLDHAALSTNGPTEDEAGRVRLMTLHKAKGLEFEHAFLPGWEAGIFPPHYGEIDEERRLAYVALTRGKRRVTISYAKWRRGYTGPCAFIGDIPENYRVAGWLYRLQVATTLELRPSPSGMGGDPFSRTGKSADDSASIGVQDR